VEIAVFDTESYGLTPDHGLLLCLSVKNLSSSTITTIRADHYPAWSKHRTQQKEFVTDCITELEKYDIIIGHNALFHDRKYLLSLCVKYELDPTKLKNTKLIDPVLISRNKLKLSRNSLASLIDFLEIKEQKTPILWKHWNLATFEGNKKSMDTIVHHCELDVITLQKVYVRLSKLVGDINSKGSDK
jgi:uncharacterized protein YprB with RNaseH-like and TPR domain